MLSHLNYIEQNVCTDDWEHSELGLNLNMCQSCLLKGLISLNRFMWHC